MKQKNKHIIITILSLMVLIISIIVIKVFANGESGTMRKINNDIGIMHTWPDGSPRHDAAYCLAGENACREGDNFKCVADLVFRNDGVMLNGEGPIPYNRTPEALAAFSWVANEDHGYTDYGGIDKWGNCRMQSDPSAQQVVIWNFAPEVMSVTGCDVNAGVQAGAKDYGPDYYPIRIQQIKDATTLDEHINKLLNYREPTFGTANGGEAQVKEDNTEILIGPLTLNAYKVNDILALNGKGERLNIGFRVYEGNTPIAVGCPDLKGGREFYVVINKEKNQGKWSTRNIKITSQVQTGECFGTYPEAKIWKFMSSPGGNEYPHQHMITFQKGTKSDGEPRDLSIDVQRGSSSIIIQKYGLKEDGTVDLEAGLLGGAKFRIFNKSADGGKGQYVQIPRTYLTARTEGLNPEDGTHGYDPTTGTYTVDYYQPASSKNTDIVIFETKPGVPIILENLMDGDYTIEEVDPPAGYELAENVVDGVQTFNIPDNGGESRDFHNKKKPGIRINKYEVKDNGEVDTEKGILEGARFIIRKIDGEKVQYVKHDDGYNWLINNSSYEVKEEDYIDEDDVKEEDLKKDSHFTFTNIGGQSLQIFGLEDGEYEVEEVIPPDGYYLSTEEEGNKVKIQIPDQLNQSFDFHNKKSKENRIRINKYGLKANGEVDTEKGILEGARFIIRKIDGEKVQYVKHDDGYDWAENNSTYKVKEEDYIDEDDVKEEDLKKDSHFTFTNIGGQSLQILGLKDGKYEVEEVIPPTGYELSTNGDGAGNIATIQIPDQADQDFDFHNPKETDDTITLNKYAGTSTGEANTAVRLGGAKLLIKFKPKGENDYTQYLIPSESTSNNEAVVYKVTDSNYKNIEGTAVNDSILFKTVEGKRIDLKNLKDGDYAVEEIEPPQGYLEDQKTHKFSVPKDYGKHYDIIDNRDSTIIIRKHGYDSYKDITDNKTLLWWTCGETTVTCTGPSIETGKSYNYSNPYRLYRIRGISTERQAKLNEIAATIHKILYDEGWTYGGVGAKAGVVFNSFWEHRDYANSHPVAKVIDCSTYVDYILTDFRATYPDAQNVKLPSRWCPSLWGTGIGDEGHPCPIGEASGGLFEDISNQGLYNLKQGDFILWEGHIQMFAGYQGGGTHREYVNLVENLPGAGFTIKNVTTGEYVKVPSNSSNGEYRITRNDYVNVKEVSDVTSADSGVLFVTQGGKGLKFNGLKAGTYKVEEVIPPDGYLLSNNGDNGTNIQTFVIPADGNVTELHFLNKKDIPSELIFKKLDEESYNAQKEVGLEGFKFEIHQKAGAVEYPELRCGLCHSDNLHRWCRRGPSERHTGRYSWTDSNGGVHSSTYTYYTYTPAELAWNAEAASHDSAVDEAIRQYNSREEGIRSISPITTDKEGKADIAALKPQNDDKRGLYYMIETSVGTNPYYNIDKTPFDIDYNTETNEIIKTNKRKRVDIEGYIWEDLPKGKDYSEVNGLKEDNELLLNPIEVRLKNGNRTIGKAVVTEDGYYRLRIGGKDGNDLQDITDPNTYVEFTYNGMKYQSSYIAGNNGKLSDEVLNNPKGTKALETIDNRNNFNARYTTITSGKEAEAKNTNKAESDGTEINFSKDSQQYRSTIKYEGRVNGSFSRDESESEPTGDAKYTVSKMPGANEDPETDQKGVNQRDDGYADKCHYLNVKNDGNKYQIQADTNTGGYSIAQHYLDEIVKNGNNTIKNVNLGLYRREQPDISLANDIYKVMVGSNTEENGQRQEKWYTYGEKTKDENSENLFTNDQSIGVRFENNRRLGTYTREVSPSEVKASDSKDFEVKVVYRTIIRNESTNLVMQPTELISNYDTDYVNIKNVSENPYDENLAPEFKVDWHTDGNDENKNSIAHSSWMKQDSTHNATGNYQSAYGKVNATIKPGKSIKIYTQYTFGREQAWAMYNETGRVPFYNHMEVNAYTTTLENQKRGLNDTYAGVDTDSAVGNSIPEKLSSYEDDNDDAPVFELVRKDNRTISGTVFKDMIDPLGGAGEEYKANGENNPTDGDKPIEGVQVELVEVDNDGNEILWKSGEDRNQGTQPGGAPQIQTGEITIGENVYKNERKEETTKVELDPNPNDVNPTVQALTYTDSNGNYTFSGFIPGRYVIRYTWGGRSSTVPVQDPENGSYLYPEQYKSTIFKDKPRYDSYVNVGNNPSRWLLRNDYQGKSNAVDDMVERYNIDKQMHIVDGTSTGLGNDGKIDNSASEQSGNYIDVDEKGTLIHSRTPAFEIGVEALDKNNDDGSEIAKDDPNTELKGDQQKLLNVSGVDFGITERPKMNMSLEKRIERVKITLANEQTLVDAVVDGNNIEGVTLNSTYMAPNPNNTTTGPRGDIGTFKVEMDGEIMQGATLEITYKYIISNNSNIDYEINGDDTSNPYEFNKYINNNIYYKFGIITNDIKENPVEMQPTVIVDYLDNKMNYLRKTEGDDKAPEENDYWERITGDIDQVDRIQKYFFDFRDKYLLKVPTNSEINENYEDYSRDGKVINANGEVIIKQTDKRMEILDKYYWTLLRDQSSNGDIGKLGSTEKDKNTISLRAGETNESPRINKPIKLVASKVLTSTNEDMEFYNSAEIIKITKTGGGQPEKQIPGNKFPLKQLSDTTYEPDLEPSKEKDGETAEQTTIVPPTGDIYKNYEKGVITAVALGGLSILGIGTAIIRRMVVTLENRKHKK